MTMTWAINPSTNDLYVTSTGSLMLVTGAQEVGQRVLITLQHYWQEYFLNVPAGVPWYELILGNKDRRQVEAILRQIVFSVPGVLSIVKFEVTRSYMTRGIDISMLLEVEGTDGPEVIEIIRSTNPKTINDPAWFDINAILNNAILG